MELCKTNNVVPEQFWRTGKNAITLRTPSSKYIPVISEKSYTERSRKPNLLTYRGSRPMHRTTLSLHRGSRTLDYITLYQHYFYGSKTLDGVRRPPSCPSMFTNQWNIGGGDRTYPKTNMEVMFAPKLGESVKDLRKKQTDNWHNNVHGTQMLKSVNMGERLDYHSSYKSHNDLGRLRGNGVPHYRKQPTSFNLISGEAVPYSAPDHRLQSGNRILSRQRRRELVHPTLQLG